MGGDSDSHSDSESDTNETFRLMLGVIAGVGAVTGPTIKGLLLSVNQSSNRGTVFGIQTLTDDLGKGCAPIIISYAMTTIGKPRAIGYAMDCFLISSFFIGLTFFSIDNDFIVDEKSALEHIDSEAIGATTRGGYITEDDTTSLTASIAQNRYLKEADVL